MPLPASPLPCFFLYRQKKLNDKRRKGPAGSQLYIHVHLLIDAFLLLLWSVTHHMIIADCMQRLAHHSKYQKEKGRSMKLTGIFLSLTKYVHICIHISCICALLISTHACILWRHSFPFITGMFQPKNKVVMIGPHSCLCIACSIGSPFQK